MSRQPAVFWPVLAALILLMLSVQGAFEHTWPQDEAGLTSSSELESKLAGMLDSGRYYGWAYLIQRHRPEHAFYVEVRNRDASMLALWPEPFSKQQWGPLASTLNKARQRVRPYLGVAEQRTLVTRGQTQGELIVWRFRPLFRMPLSFWLYALGILTSVFSLLGLMRAQEIAPAQASLPEPDKEDADSHWDELGVALEHVDVAMLLVDAQAQVRQMNALAQSWTGWSEDQALGLPVQSVLRLVNAEPDFNSQTAGAWQGFASLRPRHGELRPLQLQCVPLANQDVLWMLQDRTAAQKELLDLQDEADLARKTLNYMSDGLAILDSYGRVLRANNRMHQMFGYAEGELLGMTLAKLMPVPFMHEPDLGLDAFVEAAQAPKVVAWRRNASTFPADLQAHALGEGEQAWLILLRDRSARNVQDNQARRLRSLQQMAPFGILILDPDSLYINEANSAAQQLLARDLKQLRRMRLNHFLPQLDDDDLIQVLEELRSPAAAAQDFMANVPVNGSEQSLQIRLSWSADEEPPVLLVYFQPFNTGSD